MTADAKAPKINATTFFAHGHLLERQGNLEKAVAQYEEALRIQPDFVTAINRLGITLNKLGRNAEATQRFERAVALAPSAPFLFNNLGFSLYLEGRYDEAEAALRRAVELKPDFTRASMNLGMTFGKQMRFEEALVAFRTGSDEANAYYNLGVVQSDARRYTDAVRSFSRALEIDPKLDIAREHMQEISELAAAQELSEQLAREQIAYHQKTGSLTDAEMEALLGPRTVTDAELTSAPLTPVTPVVEPSAVESTNPSAVSECIPPQTEADFFDTDTPLGFGVGRPNETLMTYMTTDTTAGIVCKIDALVDSAVCGISTWAEIDCEIDTLLTTLVGMESAPAPAARSHAARRPKSGRDMGTIGHDVELDGVLESNTVHGE